MVRFFSSMFASLGSGGARHCRRSRPAGRRLAVEALEDRLTPSLSLLAAGSLTATEGQPLSPLVVAEVQSTATSLVSATITWGDGQVSSGTITATGGLYQISGSNTYAEEMSTTASVTVTNQGGDSATVYDPVTVGDAPLRVSARTLHLTAGQSFSGVVATISDADPNGAVSDYTASIDWGDGQTSPGTVLPSGSGAVEVTGTHSYAKAGSYPLNVGVSDAGGAQAASLGSFSAAAPLTTARLGFAAAAGRDGSIYAIGGGLFFGTLSSVERYDPATSTWSFVAPLNTPRMDFAATTGSDGSIYAIGGYSAGRVLGSVERYDPAANTWSSVAPLNTPRMDFAAATGSDGSVYAIGGSDANNNLLSSVERYNPATNTWSFVAPLNTPRAGLAAVAGSDGSIYAIGGGSIYGTLSSVERYDPATNTWSFVAPLNTPRANLAATTGSDGSIYAVGGIGGNGPLGSVERYDPATSTWSFVAPLNTPREEFAAAMGSGGSLYAIGGLGANNKILSSVEVGDTSLKALVSPDLSVPTLTTLTASTTTPTFQQTVVFAATVASSVPGGGAPGGTVTLLDGSTPLGSAGLGSGVALFSVSTLALGGHAIHAVYSPAAGFTASGSAALAVAVGPAGTSTALATSPQPALAGQAVTLTATVSPQAPATLTPTGSVTFLVDGRALKTVTLSKGVALFTTKALTVGIHQLGALYSPASSNYTGSTAAPLNEQIDRVAVAAVGVPAAAGRPFSVQARALTAAGAVDVRYHGLLTLVVQAGAGPATRSTVHAVGGVADFTGLVLKRAGRYTLRLMGPGSSRLVSLPLTVTASPLTAELVEPAVSAGTAFAVRVKAAAPGDHGPVTVTLANGPAGGTLEGTRTRAFSNGEALFTGLVLKKKGSYTLRFSSGSLGTALDITVE
jgi:N-acetylneuraminic acid mutarotase